MKKPILTALLLGATLSSTTLAQAQVSGDVVELPLVSGWFEGKVVRYVTTDVSDKKAAAEMGANYVPRLANAIVQQPQPGQPSAIERIYSVANFKQGSVLPSLPQPLGVENQNRNYSPLWQVYLVTWLPGQQAHVLKSEEEVLAAEDAGQLKIEKTQIVVNCPVVLSADGSALPDIKIRLAKPDSKS